MKLAHRIITPVLALGAIAMGLFMKLFYFGLNFDESVSELAGGILGIASLFVGGQEKLAEILRPFLNYEYSAFELIRTFLSNGDGADTSAQQMSAFLAVFEPIKTELIVFLVFLLLAVAVLVAIAVVSAMGKRKATIIASCVGLVFLMGSIVSARIAFDSVMAGNVDLGALASSVVENPTIKTILEIDAAKQLVSQCITVQTAILSSGFFALFGMFLLIIFWTILSNMLIKTPIHTTRKHRKKIVIKKPSAYFQK